jgi:predicted transposase/invertase (TIGR01784 family)
VKTDSLLYRIFRTAPVLFFELIDQPHRQGYEFQSIEIKQTAHRIDGVFLPPPDQPTAPIFFAEFQFQPDPWLYHRLFAEIFMYLEQHPTLADWQAVVLYPSRTLEPTQTHLYRALLTSPQVQRLYLDELSTPPTLPLSTGLMQLLVASRQQAPRLAQQLLTQTETTPTLPTALIIELIIVIMVYKFPQVSREEIIQMLEIATEAQQTRFYQEAREDGLRVGRQEGLQAGERSLLLRLLQKRLGELPETTRSRINTLSLEQLETLGDALLDFQAIADLDTWLQRLS